MSDPEGSSWFSGSGDLQWLCMVTLFAASLVTLLLYLVQYIQQGGPAERGHPGPTPTLTPARGQGQGQEVEALLDWVLSLGSWRSQWRGVWCRALNTEARRSGGQVLLSFDEDGLQASELVVRQVSNFHKEAGHKATRCTVVGEKLQFCLSAAAPPAGESQRYTVKMAPLQMQLDLDFQEAAEQVKVSWSVCRLEARELELSLSSSQDNGRASSASEVREEIKRLLCSTRPSVSLSCRSAQAAGAKSCSRVLSPPKPPRAHDWKLLVKNFRVTLGQQGGATGGVDVNPVCALLLDDPPQRFSTSVQKNTATPTWDQPFIFELNGRSKELNIQLLNDGEPPERSSLGQVSVPFDLVKKYPRGQQTFALTTKDGTVTGSLTTEFTYLEPSEVRSWQPPTPAPTKRVEMDRTVMPCGTVVTTITAVKSKPGRLLPLPALPATTSEPPQKWSPGRLERHVSEQPSPLGGTVSKALSSSDTELLMLNGADPVAEAAIRQLHQSAKQKLKSPVKKSTIIISGIAKTPVCQDDELALMADYAAAMDASMSECSSTQDVTAAAVATGTSSSSVSPAPNDDVPGMRQTPGGGTGCPPVAWDEQAGDNEVENVSLSMCVSEASCKKRRGSFLQKSAKLFFRRRHQRKDPGMSQSHNDLEHLEHPAVLERASRTATLSRMLNRKLLPRQRSKANGATSVGEPRQ